MSRTLFVLPLLLPLVGVAPGYADLLGHEPFDYVPVGSDLLGKNGGSGFGPGAWFASGYNALNHTNYDIAGQSLSYPQLQAEGNRVRSDALSAIAGLGRSLADPIAAGQTTTRYISFLLRPEGVLGGGAWDGFFGLYLDGTGDADLFVGKPGAGAMGKYVLEDRGGQRRVLSDATAVLNQTALFVLKAEFTPGLDRFTLYVDPDPINVEPTSGTTKSDLNVGDVNSLVIYSTGAFSMDELRIGESYSDVVAIPEPHTLVLLSMAAVGALVCTRRRHGRYPTC